MPLDDQTSRPLYRQVADELRGQIQRQELTPGGQLPTEAKLMDMYGVSRNTIRLALEVLRQEGLVITGQGRGSFVADVAAGVVPRHAREQRHLVASDRGRTPASIRCASGRAPAGAVPRHAAEPDSR
jgi:GntR family transcriptional regulator